MTENSLEAEIVFDSYRPQALRMALAYAGENGFVASMPQLLHARVEADFDNIIWNTWFTSNTEENVVTTPQGSQVVVTIHGGGIFATPERFEENHHASVNRLNSLGFTGQYAARISTQEASDVLNGRLPDGSEIPVYPFAEFNAGIPDLPGRYGVVLDFERAKSAPSGHQDYVSLLQDPNMVVRAGGVPALAAYLDKIRQRNQTTTMGNWHAYNRIKPRQSQTRVPLLMGNPFGEAVGNDDHPYKYDADYGLTGNTGMGGMGRYVAVAAINTSTSVRNLGFVA